ncbi:hypothetical protein ILUMI_24607 [Ignelater luminosus]|uniref:UDP-glucuronosyltransferase n=1 Tax=Ignelater luminosus TaxID=2038154 RepID=A0A8K0CC80_IGNLU|nr:hypothetical protein ILUMI_24607 [Ignelater luminosus]
MALKEIIAIFLHFQYVTNGANILAIFPYPFKSHFILGSTLSKALANRGHHITMLSPFLLETPIKNYEQIKITGIMEKFDSALPLNLSTSSILNEMYDLYFSDPFLTELLASNRTFDLVILSWVTNEAFLAIPYHFGAAAVICSPLGGSKLTNYVTRNSAPYSYVPFVFGRFPRKMNFFQRVSNIVTSIGFDVDTISRGDDEGYRQKYFPDAPSIWEIVKNISLVLLNSHYSIENPRPYVPNMIQIGTFHLQESYYVLNEDLKAFLDSAKEGVIFFSLGSLIQGSYLFQDKLDGIIKCFSKLPVKILWKFDKENVQNLSANVKISKWFPQREILAHQNTKLFITHGGQLSSTEALHSGVPMVGIPIYGDQEYNIGIAVNKGYALEVSFEELSEETFCNAINEVLDNPRYRDNVKKNSLILRDQPMRPIDRAVYWIEYVLQHNKALHLRSNAVKLYWHEYALLDVLAFVLGLALLVLVVLYYFTLRVFKNIWLILLKLRAFFYPVA